MSGPSQPAALDHGHAVPAMPAPLTSWLVPGATCWRQERAARVAILHDGAAYFAASREAILKARSSVMLIGWSFDPRVRLTPQGEADRETMADLLRRLKATRPEVEIHLLIWDMPWPISAGTDLKPDDIRALLGPGIEYVVDSRLPFGACQHQKVLVVDDRIAFSGGSDFEVNRWDTPAHRDRDPLRRLPTGEDYPPRHDVMMLVDGAAASALSDLARQRWQEATSGRLASAVSGPVGTDARGPSRPDSSLSDSSLPDPWPDSVTPLFEDVTVGLARTIPARETGEAIRENEALYLLAIRRASRHIYLENQYFTSPLIAEALAARLAEPEGPDIVVVLAKRSPNGFDRITMDGARRGLIARLRAADRYGRLRILAPHTLQGRPILVHSKVAIFDDRMLRVGSTNLNNRSMGYDTECDLALETLDGDAGDARRIAIARVRNGLIAHHAGCPRDAFEEAVREKGLLAAIDDPALVPARRLCSLVASRRGPVVRLVEAFHLGDPVGLVDAWRPWRRHRALARRREGANAVAGQQPVRAGAAQPAEAS
ncbi:phospholipase D-like domain-containing protein [Methylobacterium sp. WCS2018Hpa-22]|uniref:phospholipase D-like domain-containing protein n=1 Tax=Methylobacterium sp. WCS2018Hpa-22 TaxID=3073633 RepID=UPI00288915C5|nr:phospholipase D-like domain-containing protein [Methylobacterium sp. WCS2018Hpa-22]